MRQTQKQKIDGAEYFGVRRFVLASALFFFGMLAGTLALRASQPQSQASKKAVAPTTAPASSSRGAQLFQRDCAHCHGATGDGNSPVRATLHPKPLDLTRFQLSDAYVLQVLHDGIPGTDMPAWHVAREADLREEAAYTTRLAHPDALTDQDSYAAPDALAEAGKRVYETHCQRCHGPSGSGDGPDARKYRPRPASFHGIRPSFEGASRVIQNGIAGTAMPSWTLLTPQEIQAVTYYVRSFYNDGTQKRSTTATTGVQP